MRFGRWHSTHWLLLGLHVLLRGLGPLLRVLALLSFEPFFLDLPMSFFLDQSRVDAPFTSLSTCRNFFLVGEEVSREHVPLSFELFIFFLDEILIFLIPVEKPKRNFEVLCRFLVCFGYHLLHQLPSDRVMRHLCLCRFRAWLLLLKGGSRSCVFWRGMVQHVCFL